MLGEMIIYQKAYDLVLYAFPIINRFPKSQRFVLGQQIENSLIEVIKLIVEANKQRDKAQPLFRMDVELEKLRALIRLAKDLKFFSVKSYGVFSEKVSEIGKLLGGWTKVNREGKDV